jgi:hypothetical protein
MKEVWKDIVGYEGSYQISNKGRVKSLKRIIYRSDGVKQSYGGLLKTQYKSKRGYMISSLCKNGKSQKSKIHRLIAIHFIPNPDNKPKINHIDGNKLNNNLDNLEWCTDMENSQHAWKTGLIDNKGSKNGMSKLTKSEVLNIRNLKGKITYREIAEKHNISNANAWLIANKKRWKHI